ncbi:extracellular solute-binding protein [Pseudonocardia acaciae]|uniref:extracellular solute-binding protein n=1 Tax=Pseudonocardia acaciae TaxID=551276 RepID=UPI00048B4C30|nr:extracellular solute-binding protein [Pseudonocardia acaciae]
MAELIAQTTRRALSRRRLFGLAAGGLAAAGLAGCGTSQPPKSFRWQAIPTYSLVAPLPERVEYVRARLADYERETGWLPLPEVTSNDINASMAKLLLQASQGRAPEVAQVDSYVFGRFARYANDLSEPLRRAGLRLDDWFPQFRELMTTETGQPRALQFNTDVRVLYYRRDLVPNPPASWDEVFSLGRRLAAHGKYFMFCGSRSEDSVNTALWPQYWAQGGEILNPDGSPGFASGPARRAMIDSLGFLRRLVTEGVTPQRISTLRGDDDVNPDVLAGNVAMFMGGSWQGADLQKLVKGADFGREWGAAPVPSRSGDNHRCVAGGWTWASFAKDPEVAVQSMKLVIDGYCGDSGMARWCTLGGYLPTRESVYDHPEYHGDAFTPVFREHLRRYARVRPLRREYQQVSNAMQIALSSVTSLSKEPEAAVDAALAQIV